MPLGRVQDLEKALPGHGVQAPDPGPRQHLGRDKTRLARTTIRHLPSERYWPIWAVFPTPRTSYTFASLGVAEDQARAYSVSDEEEVLMGSDVMVVGGGPGRQHRGCRVAGDHDLQRGGGDLVPVQGLPRGPRAPLGTHDVRGIRGAL